MPKSQEFTDEDKQRALQMYRDDLAITKICDVVGCSRTTFYNWRNNGELTDGKHWDEWLDDHATHEITYVGNEIAEAELEDADEFWSENIPKLRRAVQRSINKMAEGEMLLGPDDVETVVAMIRRVENRGAELRQLQEEFMRKAAIAIRETEGIDKQKFQLIMEKIKQISLDQLREVDGEYAEAVVDDAT